MMFTSKKRVWIPVAAIAAVFLLVFNNCKKSDPVEPYYESDYGDLQYTIDNVKDVSIERIGEIKQNISINRVAGKAEDVSLSIVGLPAGASAFFDPSPSKPTFTSTLTIKTNRVTVGTYSLLIRGSSLTSGFTERKFSLTVLPYSNIAIGMEGKFKESGICVPGGGVNDTVDVVPVTTTVNKITIKGIWSGVWTNAVDAELTPSTKTLNILPQTVNGVTISGSGTFDENVMIIGYRVTGTTVNDTCTSTFSRL
jgi:hypothetical protein